MSSSSSILVTSTSNSIPADRTKRVKDARSEAQKEIEEYRAKKEAEFKKLESEVCRPRTVPVLSHHTNVLVFQQQHGGNEQAEKDADQETESKLVNIKVAGEKSGNDVVESLLRAVMYCQPEVPDRIVAKG